MAASKGVTNKGRWAFLSLALTGAVAGLTTSFKAVLCTSAQAPTVDTNTLSQLTEVANGNGYTTGGLTVEKSATGFDSITQDDAGDKAVALIKDLSWTASGAGITARYLVLTDDNATEGDRNVFAWWELADGADTVIPAGQALLIKDTPLELTTPA